MFYNASFAGRNIPLVVHCEWSPSMEWGRLWICSTKGQIEELIAGPVTEGIAEFATLGNELPETSDNPLVAVHGDLAHTMGADIVTLINQGVSIETLSDNSDLSGFKIPPDNRPPGEMLLVWVDPEVKYHAVIARSKQQASSIVRGLVDWMPSSRRKGLLQSIEKANMPERSDTVPYRIEGQPAELIHWASLWYRLSRGM
ncbi:MAG: hypothetical protein JWL75_618 [Parcubacteria group bacterium]|nr:hypothetical protein [Parcubacteria group bacterium]